MSRVKEFVLSKLARGILNDPVYKDYYLIRSELANGDILFSPVMSHENYMIYNAGLRAKVLNGEIKHFGLLGRGSEDDMTDLLYSESEKLNKFYNSI